MFTPYYESAYDAARLVRQVVPDALVLLGGQHPTVAHHHALQEATQTLPDVLAPEEVYWAWAIVPSGPDSDWYSPFWRAGVAVR